MRLMYLLCVFLLFCIVLFAQVNQQVLLGVDDGRLFLQLLSETPHTLFNLHLNQTATSFIIQLMNLEGNLKY